MAARQARIDQQKIVELSGIIFILGGLFLWLCLLTFNDTDPMFFQSAGVQTIHNFGGVVGSYFAGFLLKAVGLLAFIFPVGCFCHAYLVIHKRQRQYPLQELLLLVVLFHGGAAFVQLVVSYVPSGEPLSYQAGGIVGQILADGLMHILNKSGAIFFLGSGLLLGVVWWAGISLPDFLKGLVTIYRRLEVFTRKVQHLGAGLLRQREIQKKHLTSLVKKELLVMTKKTKQTLFPVLQQQQNCQTQPHYEPPGYDLLTARHEGTESEDANWLHEQAAVLEATLSSFAVAGQVTDICPGPFVTMYEFTPAAGVKISKVVRLADNLAMALHAVSARVIAPLPGRGVVGIEIPNKEHKIIGLRQLLESKVFQKSQLQLPIVLGEDTYGSPVIADLNKMPHLLVAGATGSGKSVLIHTMIISLLFRMSPRDLSLIMIDPKMVELQVYAGIPHLLQPVIGEAQKGSQVLLWVVEEMERRYKLFSAMRVRGLAGYNKKLVGEENRDDHGHLPYLVVVIDELSDLMMSAGREVEDSICRLAQKARAAGIHLILTTQRPSVDVITGIIKANLPARIALQVASAVDSRTILDQRGAESLLGQGDMLFLSPDNMVAQRVHGAFVADDEIVRVVEAVRNQYHAGSALKA